MSVGFIGLGNMGQGMSDNLLAKGASLTVFTRTRSKIDTMVAKGAKGADSLQELVQGSDIVLACLPDVETCREAFLGENGIIDSATAGQVVVDHSTVDLKTTRDCAAAASARGVYFLDAPISGGSEGANNGTLSIMVGGEDHAYATALNEFERMGTYVRHMGPSGAGTAMKLINQLLTGVNNATAAEAWALANSANVDITAAAEILNVSFGGSRMVERSAPIAKERAFPNSGSPVRTINKDMGIIADLAEAEGLALGLATYTSGLYREMMEQGKSEHDIAGVLEIVEQRSSEA